MFIKLIPPFPPPGQLECFAREHDMKQNIVLPSALVPLPPNGHRVHTTLMVMPTDDRKQVNRRIWVQPGRFQDLDLVALRLRPIGFGCPVCGSKLCMINLLQKKRCGRVWSPM